MSDSRAPASAKQVRTGVAVLVAASVVYALLAQTVFPFGADEALYIGAAKSMAAGHGYQAAGRFLSLYPPGWPLLLVPVEWLTNGAYGWFSRYTAALIPLMFYASWMLFSSRAERRVWWLIAALVASTAVFDFGTREVRSEIAFTALTTGFLAWAERTKELRPAGWLNVSSTFGALLLLGALGTRSIGVALFGAVVMTGLHVAIAQRDRFRSYAQRMMLPLLTGALYEVIWGRWAKAHVVESYPGEPTAYNRQFWLRDGHNLAAGEASVFEVLGRIPGNIRIQAAHVGSLLTNIDWIAPTWTSPIVVVATVALIAGLVDEWRRKLPLLCWYVVGYMSVLSVWTYDEGTRYIMPLIPLLVLLAVSGYRAIARIFAQRPGAVLRAASLVAAIELAGLSIGMQREPGAIGKQTLVAFAFWGVCIVTGLLTEFRMILPGSMAVRRIVSYSRLAYIVGYFALGATGIVRMARFNRSGEVQLPGQAIRRVSDWLAANATDSSIVMARQYGSLNLITHRRTVPYPQTLNVDLLRNAIIRQKPTLLVVIDSTAYEYYFPSEPARLAVIEKAINARLTQRARLQGASIYEFPRAIETPSTPYVRH